MSRIRIANVMGRCGATWLNVAQTSAKVIQGEGMLLATRAITSVAAKSVCFTGIQRLPSSLLVDKMAHFSTGIQNDGEGNSQPGEEAMQEVREESSEMKVVEEESESERFGVEEKGDFTGASHWIELHEVPINTLPYDMENFLWENGVDTARSDLRVTLDTFNLRPQNWYVGFADEASAKEAAGKLHGLYYGLKNIKVSHLARDTSEFRLRKAEKLVDKFYIAIVGAHADTEVSNIMDFLRGYNIAPGGITDLGVFKFGEGNFKKKFLVDFMIEDECFQAARIKHRQVLLDQKLEVTLMFTTINHQKPITPIHPVIPTRVVVSEAAAT